MEVSRMSQRRPFLPFGLIEAANLASFLLLLQLLVRASCLPDREQYEHKDVLQFVQSPNGRILASVSAEDHSIRLWDGNTNKPRATLTGHLGRVDGVAFSPDEAALASAGH